MTLSSRKKVTLGELGSFKNGVNFKKEQMGSGLKLVNVKDLFGDGPYIDFQPLDLVDLGGVANISRYAVEANDLFFVRSSVKRDGVELGQDGYPVYIRINAVADGNIDQTVFSCDRDGWICAHFCEGIQAGAPAPTQDRGQHVV